MTWQRIEPEPSYPPEEDRPVWKPTGNVKGPPGEPGPPGPPGPPGAPGEAPDDDLMDLTLIFQNGLI